MAPQLQLFGWKEGRNPNALFDTNGYLATYGDMKAAGINPLDHYHVFGWQEGRDPSVGFDTTSYLGAYSDVAAAHIDPLAHFLQFGSHEGRSPFADGIGDNGASNLGNPPTLRRSRLRRGMHLISRRLSENCIFRFEH